MAYMWPLLAVRIVATVCAPYHMICLYDINTDRYIETINPLFVYSFCNFHCMATWGNSEDLIVLSTKILHTMLNAQSLA